MNHFCSILCYPGITLGLLLDVGSISRLLVCTSRLVDILSPLRVLIYSIYPFPLCNNPTMTSFNTPN